MKKSCPKCLGTGEVQDQAFIGQTCWKRRTDAGLSLAEVSERMNISASHLSYLEAGKRSWSPELLHLFGDALKLGKP